jgi:hypothetical protein
MSSFFQSLGVEPFSLLANLLLSITAATLLVSLLAYIAYKIRERRKPSRDKLRNHADRDKTAVFLQLYVPEREDNPPLAQPDRK